MDKFEIKTYESVGNIILGSDRETVRNNNGNFKEFRKSIISRNTSDDFKSFHVYYNPDNTVSAVEFFRESNLYFCNIPLFSKTYNELKTLLMDSNIIEDSSSLIYKTLGFSIYSPDKNQIESVIVFEKGYYD